MRVCTMGEQRLSPWQILRLAQQVVEEFFSSEGDATRLPFPSALMLASIAWIESHGDFYAERAEPHLQDSSVGLCQLLTSTAGWLAEGEAATCSGVVASNVGRRRIVEIPLTLLSRLLCKLSFVMLLRLTGSFCLG